MGVYHLSNKRYVHALLLEAAALACQRQPYIDLGFPKVKKQCLYQYPYPPQFIHFNKYPFPFMPYGSHHGF